MNTIHELTDKILKETGYKDYVKMMIGGPQRDANLNMFIDQVYAYERSSYKGLFDFMRYMAHIKKQSIDYGIAELGESASNQVSLMSIHKSKGLEYPIVIVAGMGKQFNRMDMNKSVLMHQDLGFGTDTILTDDKLKITSPIKQVIRNKMDIELLSEEMRILYVAFTRAREKLILVGSVKDVDKYVEKWCKVLHEDEIQVPPLLIQSAKSLMDFLMIGLIRHKSIEVLYKHLAMTTIVHWP